MLSFEFTTYGKTEQLSALDEEITKVPLGETV